MGFHAPQEAARVLLHSVDYSPQGQAAIGNLTIRPSMAAPPPEPQTVTPAATARSKGTGYAAQVTPSVVPGP